MGWLKELDMSDAALFITLFTLTAVVGIATMSAFTDIESNGIVMIVLGKLMVILDAAIFYFFQSKKAPVEPSKSVLLDYVPEEAETPQDGKPSLKPPYDLNPL